jgi:hypothetical protein
LMVGRVPLREAPYNALEPAISRAMQSIGNALDDF